MKSVGIQGQKVNTPYLLARQAQLFDNLSKRDDLIPEEVSELLVCLSRRSDHKDISNFGRVHIPGLGDALMPLTRAEWMTKCEVLHLAALEGRPAFGTKAGPLVVIQHFSESGDNKVLVVVARAVEVGNKTVRRPGPGLAVEVRDEVKLGERVGMTSKVVEALRVNATGGIAVLEGQGWMKNSGRHSRQASDRNSSGY